jgi:hypothetical protein
MAEHGFSARSAPASHRAGPEGLRRTSGALKVSATPGQTVERTMAARDGQTDATSGRANGYRSDIAAQSAPVTMVRVRWKNPPRTRSKKPNRKSTSGAEHADARAKKFSGHFDPRHPCRHALSAARNGLFQMQGYEFTLRVADA